jgi:hypothetical protein
MGTDTPKIPPYLPIIIFVPGTLAPTRAMAYTAANSVFLPAKTYAYCESGAN